MSREPELIALPARLAKRLCELRPILTRRGYLQFTEHKRRGRAWLLRYSTYENGRRRHHSLYVGNDERRQLVQAWLDRVRGKIPHTPEADARRLNESLQKLTARLDPSGGLEQAAVRVLQDLTGDRTEKPGRPSTFRLW